jgi:hypothetical protein
VNKWSNRTPATHSILRRTAPDPIRPAASVRIAALQSALLLRTVRIDSVAALLDWNHNVLKLLEEDVGHRHYR